MSISDQESIMSLLSDEKSPSLEFSDSQMGILYDTNNGSYQNAVNFDTLELSSKWTQLEYLTVPIRITPATAAFSQRPNIAFKGSVLSLLSGVQVKTGSGTTIVDETESSFLTEHIKMMLEHDDDWAKSEGLEVQWAKDRGSSGSESRLTSSANIVNPQTSIYSGAPDETTNALRATTNVGFVERNHALLDASQSADGSFVANLSAGFDVVVKIPLKYVSTYFANKNFPDINTRLKITFFLNLSTSSYDYKPLCLGKLDGTVETGTGCVVRVQAGKPCQLYYREVKFSPSEAKIVADQLRSGFTKEVHYNHYEINRTYKNIASTASFNHVITTNSTNPQRVWVLCHPTGVVDGQTWPSPLVTGSHGLTSANVKINGSNYFDSDFSTPIELWEELKRQMPPSLTGESRLSQLTYSDFLKTFRIHCFDLTRSNNRKQDPNAPVTLLMKASPISATAIDIIYIVETKKVCKMTFGLSQVKIDTYDV